MRKCVMLSVVVFLILVLGFGQLTGSGRRRGTAGLQYTLINGGTGYSVSKGTAANRSVVVIPATHNTLPVTAISDYGFFRCRNLKKVVLPESITRIGKSAFGKCYSLRAINFPNSITYIGNHAFDTCMKLKSIRLPDRLTTVQQGAFYGCLGLERVVIGASVERIESYAFSGCLIRVVYMLGERPPRLGSTLPFLMSALKKIYLPSRRAVRAYSSVRLPWNNYSVFYAVRKR